VPLKLRPPRKGKTPNFEIRGSYLGVHVEVSSGTYKRSVARDKIRAIEECIEKHHQYPAPEPTPNSGEPTFVSAAVAYMQAGGERAYMAPLLAHFDDILFKDVDQAAIDDAAKALLPQGAPDYQNRRIYTPISAVLHHALGDKCPTFKRPKGSKGRERKDFMWPEDAFAILEEAEKIDREFGLYLRFLLYTGIRKSEGLKLLATDVRPEDRAAWLRDSKNGDPRMLKLRLDIVAPLFEHLKGHSSERFFRFNDGGHFKHLLLRATMAACGLPCPVRRPTGWKKPKFRLAFVTFHVFRHTWATWMRMYGGADLQGLKGTGNWRDLESVQRYAHVVARDEWDRVEDLPTAKTGNKRGKAVNE
jgi:integrase